MVLAAAAVTASSAALGADIPGNKSTTATLPIKDVVRTELFEREGDADWYRVNLTRGVTYAVMVDSGFPFNADDPGIRAAARTSSGTILASTIDHPLNVGGFTFTARATGLHFIVYKHLAGVPLPTGYEARITTDCLSSIETRCALALGVERKSAFNYAEDTDYLRVSLLRSKTYTLTGSGGPGSFFGIHIGLHNATGERLWGGFLDNSSITFRPPADGTHFISASANDDFDYKYRLLLRTP
jgi:hypothetical protein